MIQKQSASTERQIKGKFIQTTPESYTGDITMEAITTD